MKTDESSVFGSIIVMLLSSIVAGGAWKCQRDESAGLLNRCRSIEVYSKAMRELYDGGWIKVGG